VNNDTTEMNARFLPDFATYGFFDALGGFQETGQSGVPVGRPALLTS
jgi:hypothetical protein